MTEQERWQLVADIVDQLWQDLYRQRKGTTLSNIMGVRRSIDTLVEDVRRSERAKPKEVRFR